MNGSSGQSGGRPRSLSLIAGAVVIGAVFALFRARTVDDSSGVPCDPATGADCEQIDVESEPRLAASAPALSAAEACRNVGYLCADLASQERIQLRRWKDFSGTIVVHIPRPDFESVGDATRLQQAAALGLRAWNGQPFEIMADVRGDRNPHFAVRWLPTLNGNQIGVARTQWSFATGLTVVSIELTTRNPFDTQALIDPAQIRLTAAHEMGHALGLPHSDSSRDVMFPTNTATSLTAQDYRTMESLYLLADGTEIVR